MFLMVWIMSGVLATYTFEQVVGDDTPATLVVHFLVPPVSLIATGLTYLVYGKPNHYRVFKK